MRILNTIGRVYTEAAKPILEKIGDVDYRDLTQEELKTIIGDYEIAVVGLGLTFNKEVLAAGKNLKVVATATTGLDHIDTKFAEERGVTILSLRGENEFLDTITGTAELACGLMIDLLRFTPWAFDDVKVYRWDREKFRGHNLYSLTLGVFGMGRLGKWMARYGKAFGMRVLYTDPYVTKSPVEVCTSVSFDELLKESDVLSLHVHLNDETRGVFDENAFKKMKKGAYLINTARGGIVDEKALLEALKRGGIAGYGTDVLTDETNFNKEFNDPSTGLRASHPLVEYAKDHKNVIILPHIGGMTAESRERTDVFIAEKVKMFFDAR